MNDGVATLAASIAVLRDAYPRADFPDKTVALYGRMLGDQDPAEVAQAVARLIRSSKYLPTIAEIRREVAEAALRLPTPAEAWELVNTGNARRAGPEVQAALAAIGGRHGILASDNLNITRAQFLRDYTERRENAVSAFVGSRVPPVMPGAPMLGPTMASLPETDRIRPRPVMARLMARWGNRTLSAPTEEEKADAVLILRDGSWSPDPKEDSLYCEAERIFMEASS